ncbi:UDP-N-acetylmuramoyl-tripeptide--D-alanyl-D-alanine ligase [Paenibacillus sp. FA6]|uniref:UDP-N-acetylmuramoyl-tripeptide--D-alanyl-D- alanine ligase n=1 Tax=Paenibacillus sp. FA6 TaxID=3413029 RepID=UPI003F660243
MINKTLGEIAVMCGGNIVHAQDQEKLIHGVTTDSRHIAEGSLFIPLVGERYDGHEFVARGLAEGAGATLWQRDRGIYPLGAVIEVDDTLVALQLLAKSYLKEIGSKVVGITGSNGKTTTKDMVAALLETTYKVHKTEGNFNNHIGLPLTILGMSEDVDIVVLEMGMSGRDEIRILSAIAQPDIAVISNIGESHLLQLGSREGIASAKLEIVSGMKPGGLLIYNGDEPLIPQVLADSTTLKPVDLQTFTFGIDSNNDDYPTGMMFHGKGIIFTSYAHKELSLDLPLLGRHNVLNALAALAVARHFDVSEDNIKEGLSHLQLTGMRIEQIVTAGGLTVLNDAYNASPMSVKAAIDVLQGMKGYRRKIAVLGDMLELGAQENEYHAEIGHYVTTDKVNLLYTFGPLSSYTAEAASENLPRSNVFTFTDKAELIKHLNEQIQPKDIVLVKGSRGMKLEEVVNALIEKY